MVASAHPDAEPLLTLTGIGKSFPGVVALDEVSLTVERGEILALIGENGAGKSTLMKILGGVHPADAGTIAWEGTPVSIRGIAQSQALGIAFIHQELFLCDNLDVAGNIFLGREPRRFGLVDQRKMETDSAALLARLGLPVSPRTPLAELSLAQRQLVEIAKALSQHARLLIMDEPTSSLTLAETERLLALILELKAQGMTVVYISHRMGEIERIADRVVALRDGRNAGEIVRSPESGVRSPTGTIPPGTSPAHLTELHAASPDSVSGPRTPDSGPRTVLSGITQPAMVKLMVGRDLKELHGASVAVAAPRPGGLTVTGLRTQRYPQRELTFTAERGRILGVAGLMGAGRSELAQAIFGVEPPLAGQIALDGKPLTIRNARDAITAGICLVPEDRRRTGLVTAMTVRENVTMPALDRHSHFGWILGASERTIAQAQVTALRVKTPSVEAVVANLSGGNQQKVVLGRWLALDPQVLIVDEPTRGIDVGAKAEIYRLLKELALRGCAVIVISSDLEEVLGISDRIAVMHEGRISGILERPQFSEEAVMHLAVGTPHAA